MITIYTDGICEPNPGKAAWAFIVFRDGQEIHRAYGALNGKKTNNDAEYVAFGKALRWIQENASYSQEVALLSDSQLVLHQVAGDWACNKEHLRRYVERCRELLADLRSKVRLTYDWVSGDSNPADEITRIAYRQDYGINPPIRHKKAVFPNSSL